MKDTWFWDLYEFVSATGAKAWTVLSVPGSEFWSAVTGAVVGGIIAYRMQTASLRAQEAVRDAEDKDRRERLAYSLLFKAVAMHSDLDAFKKQVENCILVAVRDGITEGPASYLVPLANIAEPTRFSADELTNLFTLKDNELFQNAFQLDRTYNSARSAWLVHAAMRERVEAKMPKKRTFDPARGATEFDLRDPSLQAAIHAANGIAEHIMCRVDEDSKLANDTLNGLQNLFNSKLGLKLKYTKDS